MENSDLQKSFSYWMSEKRSQATITQKLKITDAQRIKLLENWLKHTPSEISESFYAKINANKEELKTIWSRLQEVGIMLRGELPTNKRISLEKEFENLKIKYSQKTIWDGTSKEKNNAESDSAGTISETPDGT